GSDKPDLRNPLILQDVSEHFRGGGFGLFAKILDANPKNAVWAIPAPTGGNRAFTDRMNAWAQSEGQPGLGNIFWRKEDSGHVLPAGPIAKNLGVSNAEAIKKQLNLGEGDAAFFVAGDPSVFYKFAGLARNKIADDLNLSDKEQFAFCWIVDFP